jgi:hypothetical protein
LGALCDRARNACDSLQGKSCLWLAETIGVILNQIDSAKNTANNFFMRLFVILKN